MRGLLVVLTMLMVTPVMAATKCVQLDPSTPGVSVQNSEGVSDWTVTEANGVTVTGIGVCASTSASTQTQTANSLTFSAENHYCWCRMVSPGVSKYVFYLYYVYASECATRCNYRCGEYAQTNAAFRSAMFNSIGK